MPFLRSRPRRASDGPSAFGRFVFALMGSAFGAGVVAVAEGREAASAVGAHAPEAGAVVLGDLGVLAPLAFVVGAAVGLVALFLEPERPIPVAERIALARAEPVLTRSRTAAIALLSGVLAAVWLVATAQSARSALARDAPMASGGALAVLLRVAGRPRGGAARAAALGPEGARGRGSHIPEGDRPSHDGGGGLVVGVALVAAGVSGGHGGEGRGPLAIFGVLKRSELELRPVVDLTSIAACAWLAPLSLGGRPARPVPLAIALVVVVFPLLVTVREAIALERAPAVARAIERSAPLGRIALALVRAKPPIAIATARPRTSAGATATTPTPPSRPTRRHPRQRRSTRTAPAPTSRSRPPAAAAASTAGPPPWTATSTSSSSRSTRSARPRWAFSATTSRRRRTSTRSRSRASSSTAPTPWPRTPARRSRRCSSASTRARRCATAGTSTPTCRATCSSPSGSQAAGLFTMGAASHWYFRQRWGVTQGFDSSTSRPCRRRGRATPTRRRPASS